MISRLLLIPLVTLLLASCANGSKCRLPSEGAFPQCQKPAQYSWTTSDQVTLPYLKELPKSGKPKAVVVMFVGLDGVTGDYASITRELTQHGYAVYGSENRCSVYGPKKLQGNPKDWQAWVRDLREFDAKVRSEHPGTKIFWHGHSFGAVTALAALEGAQKTTKPDGLIVHSPGYALIKKPSVLSRLLAPALSWVRLPHITLMDAMGLKITTDDAWDCQWKNSPDRVRRGIRVTYAIQGTRMGQQARRVAGALDMPVLAMWGDQDWMALGSKRADRAPFDQFMEKELAKGKATHFHSAVGGHIMTEGDSKTEAIRAIVRWLDLHS